MSFLSLSLLLMGMMPKGELAELSTEVFTLRPDRPRQIIENFGASDSWYVEPLINWPESERQKIADLLFDRNKGIGLSAWRFNIGGGINHETISNPHRTADSFLVKESVYDWNRVPGQRWMLDAAKKKGVASFIAYAVTPPRSLTRNGFTNGTDGLGSTNLAEGKEGAYASYLADIVEHYVKKGYPFTHISPINEPDFEWNKGSQEGNRASNQDVLNIGRAVSDEFKKRQLDVKLLTPEANSPQVGYEPNNGMTRKYGSAYGAYADLFANSQDWYKETQAVYGYHSYWADRLEQLIPNRQKLKAFLDKTPGLTVWQTEYCQMAGPRGEGGWGRDLGMTLALNTARVIHLDLTIVEASAWQWWLAVSNVDYKDGIIYVDDLDKPKGSIYPSKTLWAIGNYSRFIRPGFNRIEVDGAKTQTHGTLVSAYQDPKSKRVVAVAVNMETESSQVDLNLSGAWTIQPYITSDRPGDDLRKMRALKSSRELEVPARSVVTFVFDPVVR